MLRRGESLTADTQRQNVKIAAEALAPIACEHELVICHGNGPQVGLLALQGISYKPDEAYPLDILDAETEGMIGYLIEQELINLLSCERRCATLVTQIEVDPQDPAFKSPSKPIGPVYAKDEACRLARDRGWSVGRDGDHYRRLVASPRPKKILELSVIEFLVSHHVIVICAGGGGIPTVYQEDGSLIGVEAVIDKDMASSLLARELRADVLLLLTDVDAVWQDWEQPNARAIRRISPQAIRRYDFPSGSMAPKVDAACEFVEQTGGIAGIGKMNDANTILRGEAGTVIDQDVVEIKWWD